jgi:hypothetical protein
VHRVQPPAETHRVSAVPFCAYENTQQTSGNTGDSAEMIAGIHLELCPFCAYENFGDCSQAPEKAWRPRRDLNPCYRRESRQHGWLPEAVSVGDSNSSWIINGARIESQTFHTVLHISSNLSRQAFTSASKSFGIWPVCRSKPISPETYSCLLPEFPG